jgi:hypothetical protein
MINYNLMSRRHLLLRDIVTREQQYFQACFAYGEHSTKACVEWLRMNAITHNSNNPLANSIRSAYVEILLMESADRGLCVPETFLFDYGRIRSLQRNLQELKCRLVSALNTEEVKIRELGQQILLVASRVSSSPINGEKRALLLNSVDSIMNPSIKFSNCSVKRRKSSFLGVWQGALLADPNIKVVALPVTWKNWIRW